MPDAAEVITKATGISWEAGMVALILVTCLGFLVWLVRQWLRESSDRENRMGARLDKLEDFQTSELKLLAVQCKEAVERNTASTTALKEALAGSPCLWSEERQAEMMTGVAARLKAGAA